MNAFNIPCRCTQCAEFTARCRKTTEKNERAQIEQCQANHMVNVRQYRAIQTRLCHLSEVSTSGSGVEGASSILKVDLDGLDQSKTKWPQLDNSKSLATCWRPQVHMVGCIVWGVACPYSKSMKLSTLFFLSLNNGISKNP